MPRGDRTGPNGAGPRTGRQMGFCTGNNAPGFVSSWGWGFGRGRGFAGGWGWGFGRGRGFAGGWGFRAGWGRGVGNWQGNPEPTQHTDIQNLTDEINRLREQIADLESKLHESKKE